MSSDQKRLRILSVVTLMSPDGAFGGPCTVAVNQARALRALGHDVTIAAAARGFNEPPATVSDVPVRLFPAVRMAPVTGYAAMRARGLASWTRTNANEFDVIHIHLARDLVTMPAALAAAKSGTRYVLQTHGMIAPRKHAAISVIDRLYTRRLMSGAAVTFSLSHDEERDLRAVLQGTPARISVLRNGVPIPEVSGQLQRADPPEVLFLGRLHPRKRPELFTQAAISLLRSGVRAQFRLAGPAEGSDEAIRAAIDAAVISGIGSEQLRLDPAVPPPDVATAMAAATIFVAPAAREPFGMTIIEALSAGTPVVVADDGGLADFVNRAQAGRVVAGNADAIAQAIRDLLANPEDAAACGQRGRAAVASEFGMDEIAADLLTAYRGDA